MSLTNLDIARGAFAITPSDTVPLPQTANGIHIGSVGGGATLTCKCIDGSQVTFATVIAGQILPLSVVQVLATGTLASSLVGYK